jgi:DNA invertase Pin-like site-specific DNA recombinase
LNWCEARAGLEKLREVVRKGDVIVVRRLDRLGRSLRHLIDLMTEFEKQGVGFQSLTEETNDTTPNGKLIFHIFSALAEFEPNLIKERTEVRLKAARARGPEGGGGPNDSIHNSACSPSTCSRQKQHRLVKSAQRSTSLNRRSMPICGRRSQKHSVPAQRKR